MAVEGSVSMALGQPVGIGEPVVRFEGREGGVDGESSAGRSSSKGSKKSAAAGRSRWGPRAGVVTWTSIRHGMEGAEDGRMSAGRSSVSWLLVAVEKRGSGCQASGRRLEWKVVLMGLGKGE